jgi:O-acetyl-ADP-ribose deacetylase (regulator of RNase III)
VISTGAGELPAKKVIHAVGPIWHGGAENEELLLRQCVWKSLKKTEELGFASISIPAISSGIFRYCTLQSSSSPSPPRPHHTTF